VNCQWQYKGTLHNKKESKVSGDGKTYDNKLYTFKETCIKTMWDKLEILINKLEGKDLLKNIPSEPSERIIVQSQSHEEKIRTCNILLFSKCNIF